MAFTPEQIDSLPLSPAVKAAMKSNPKYTMMGPGVSSSPLQYAGDMSSSPSALGSTVPNQVMLGEPAAPFYGGGPAAPIGAAPYSPSADWHAASGAAPAPPSIAPAPAKPAGFVVPEKASLAQLQDMKAAIEKSGGTAPPMLTSTIKHMTPAPSAPAPKMGPPGAPMHAGAAPAPAVPIDKTTFGQTDTEKKQTKETTAFMEGNVVNQAKLNDITAKTADEYSAILDGEAAALASQQQKAEKSVKDRQAFLSRYNTETEDHIQAFQKAEVDPHRFWGSKSTGDKLVSLFGVALSGMANVLDPRRGSKNEAADMIQMEIARDIELQKGSIAKKGAGIDARRGLYASYLQQYGSEDAATAMAMETYTRSAKSKIESLMAKTSSEETKVRGGALIDAMNQQIADYKNGRAIAGEKLYDAWTAEQLRRSQAAAAHKAAMLEKRDWAMFEGTKDVAVALAKEHGGVPAVLDTPRKTKSGNIIPAGTAVALDPETGDIIAVGTAHGAGKGPPTVTVPGSLNETGQWSTAGAAEAHGPEAANKFNEVTYAAKQGLELIEKARKMRLKNNGGKLVGSSADNATAADLERDLFKAKKTAGENSDKDAERIEAIIPKIMATDGKAAVMGGVTYTDAQLNSLEKSFKADIERAKNTYLKAAPPNPTPYTKPNK